MEAVLRKSRVPEQLALTYHQSLSNTEINLSYDPLLGDFVRLVLALHFVERESKDTEELTFESPYAEELGSVAEQLERLYYFLTSFSICLRFEKGRDLTQKRFSEPQSGLKAFLFSGGLDSYCGAVNHSSKILLVHGILNNIVYGRTRKLRMDCPTLLSSPMVSCRFVYESLGGGISQTRGLLFLSLAGLAATTIGSKCAILAENGPLMLNPETTPLSPPTKNSDPKLVIEMESIISKLTGDHFQISCPNKNRTKAEMIAMTPLSFRNWFRSTNSCATTRFGKMCGLCFGCFVRRLSLAAVGHDEGDDYLYDLFACDLTKLGGQRTHHVIDLRHSLRFFNSFVTNDRTIVNRDAAHFFEDPTSLMRKFGLDLILGLSNLIKMHPNYETQNAFGRYCADLVHRTRPELIDRRRDELNEVLASQDRSSRDAMKSVPLNGWA